MSDLSLSINICRTLLSTAEELHQMTNGPLTFTASVPVGNHITADCVLSCSKESLCTQLVLEITMRKHSQAELPLNSDPAEKHLEQIKERTKAMYADLVGAATNHLQVFEPPTVTPAYE